MKYAVSILLGLAVCGYSSAAADDVLVFEGTVVSIEILPLPKSLQNFVVTMRVDRVVKGDFQGKTFQFRVHSPAMSGLNVGEKRTIEAKRIKDGYTVDQYQWNGQDAVADTLKPIVTATFAAGKEIVITPDLKKLEKLGLTVERLKTLRHKRIADDREIEIDGKKIKLTDVATVTERDLEVKPFTVTLDDGREVIVTPDAKRVERYLIPGWAFEENVRVNLSNSAVSNPAKVVVLTGIPVPGGQIPNYWTDSRHIHMSTGEPLDTFGKVEVQAKPAGRP